MSRCSRVKLTFVAGDDYMFAYVQMKTVQKAGADRFKWEHLLCYFRRNGTYVVSEKRSTTSITSPRTGT